MVLTSEWPGFEASTRETSNAGWEITPLDPQGDPFNPDFFAGDGRVLIGQFSTLDGSAIQGTMLLHYVSNGVSHATVETFFLPGPGGLPAVVLFCALGTRRRKRHCAWA